MPIDPSLVQPQQPLQRAHTRINDLEYRLRQLESRRSGGQVFQAGNQLVTFGSFPAGSSQAVTFDHNLNVVPDGAMAMGRLDGGSTIFNGVVPVGNYAMSQFQVVFMFQNVTASNYTGGSLNVQWIVWVTKA